jgi:hypothetical protein
MSFILNRIEGEECETLRLSFYHAEDLDVELINPR